MKVTKFTVKKSLLGNAYRVEYLCPKCENPLRSEEEEIGNEEACPHCGAVFVVSREAKVEIQTERERIEAEREKELARKEEVRAQREEESQRKEAERQAQAAARKAADAADERRRQVAAERTRRLQEAEAAENAPAPVAAARYSWKHRFPQLAVYLDLIDTLNKIVVGVFVVGIGFTSVVQFSWDLAHKGEDYQAFGIPTLLIGWAGAYLWYVIMKAAIQFVLLFCSIEEQLFAMRSNSERRNTHNEP